MCGLGSQRGILTGTVIVRSSQPFGETTALLWVRRLKPPGLILTLNLHQTLRLHRNLSLTRSLILHLSSLLAWALTSALEGDHETGVASALETSLARTLTLAKALPSWGPNSNV